MGLTGIAVIDVVETILTLALASKKMISALSILPHFRTCDSKIVPATGLESLKLEHRR